jgi:hypothetical protein
MGVVRDVADHTSEREARMRSTTTGRRGFTRQAMALFTAVLAVAVAAVAGASNSDADTGLVLSLHPPSGFTPLGSSAIVEARVTDAAGVPVAGEVVGVSVPGTDTSCTTGNGGTCSVSIPSRPVGGRWWLFGFIDRNSSGTFDDDEPRADGPWVVWQPEVAKVTITASAASAPAFTNPYERASVRFVVTALDASGNRVPGASLVTGIEGTYSGSGGSCVAGSNGQGECYLDVQSDFFPGPGVTVTACFDENADNEIAPSEHICAVAPPVTWTVPASTRGSIIGGGFAPNGDDPGLAFLLHASSVGNKTTGACDIWFRATGDHLRCVNVAAHVQVDTQLGPHAVVFGTATFNGTQTDYRIDIEPVGRGHVISVSTRLMSVAGITDGRTGKIVLHH